jgi:CRP-like cAMP-binding protein
MATILHNSIALYLSTNLNTKEPLPFKTRVRHYKKGDCIISVGEVEQKVNFLLEGIVETLLITPDGTERITEFFYPNNFFCSLSSFLKQKPTGVTMTCLTNCVVESFSYTDYHQALENSLLANKLGRHIAEESYLLRIKREKELLSKTASERYKDLIETRPEVVKEISLLKIAKYLGINSHSLSRIRKEIFQ